MSLRLFLYVVTDTRSSRGRGHLETARLALAGGADIVQLRDKDLPGRELHRLAVAMTEMAHQRDALLIVNDRLDVALAAGADGVHLGQDDLPVREARKLSPQGFIIGASVGSVKEAVQAERDGADYVALSPLFSTPSKTDAGPGHGLEELTRIRAAVKVPVIAIGGIDRDNAALAISAGADGVAVISAVVGQADPENAARELRAEVIEALRARRERAGTSEATGS